MGRKSPSPSWPPHRLLRCCCELVSRVRALPAEVQVDVLWELPSVPLLSAFPRLDVVPESVRVFRNPFLRQNSTSSLELRSFHVDSTAIQVVFCELICTQANHVSSPLGVRRTMHLVTTSNHWSTRSSVWLHALRDRESKRIPIHQTCTKVIHLEFQANIGMEFCRRVAL